MTDLERLGRHVGETRTLEPRPMTKAEAEALALDLVNLARRYRGFFDLLDMALMDARPHTVPIIETSDHQQRF